MSETGPKKPRGFSGYEERAEAVLKNLEKTADVVEKASRKARAQAGALRGVKQDLQDLFRMLRAWVDRSYTRVPWRALVMALAGLIYFVNPMDLMPDFLPLVGYLDDATVLAFVIRSVQKEIDRFRAWEASPR